MSLVVRTAGPPETAVAAVRSAVHEVNPALALFNVRTMKEVLSESLWQLNLYRWLFGLFAGLALVIAGVGLFGAISYGAAARMREFAIRLALGSDERALARLVIGRGLRLAAVGLVAGAALVGLLLLVLRQLPGIFRPDLLTVAIVAAVLAAISLVASALPAFRVTRVTAVTALRHD
jgi:ABC-type antimicrobial peptide transport system permease subunit